MRLFSAGQGLHAPEGPAMIAGPGCRPVFGTMWKRRQGRLASTNISDLISVQLSVSAKLHFLL
jgi:hypothetical protein